MKDILHLFLYRFYYATCRQSRCNWWSFMLQYVPFCLVIYRLLPCCLPSFALQIAVSSQKNVRNQCHSVTASRNPLAFTALRRDIAPPFNVTTVTLRLAP